MSQFIRSTSSIDGNLYALLAGRATPQTFYLATGAGATAGKISATSHVTKGILNIGDTTYFDEVNKYLGVGVVPTFPLHVLSNDLSNIRLDTKKRVGVGYHSCAIHTEADGAIDVLMNCYLSNDALTWYRFDTSRPAMCLNHDSYGDLAYYRAAAGANPIGSDFVGADIRIGRADGYPNIATLKANSYLVMMTSTALNTPIEVMRLTANQRVSLGGEASPTGQLHIKGMTLASNGTEYFFNVTGTLTSSATATMIGAVINVTGAGATAYGIIGFRSTILAGYTGSGNTFSINGANISAGTNGASLGNLRGNSGICGQAYGVTVGDNFGVSGFAYYAGRNIGVIGAANINQNNGLNVGVIGIAINLGTSPKHIGGYFGLHGTTDPTFVSAALICDNGATTDPILLIRDNGTTTWSVTDGGTLTAAEAINMAFGTTTGTKIGTATTQKISFWNAVPVIQRAFIAAPVGGGTIDAEARTTINLLRQALIDIGVTAAS